MNGFPSDREALSRIRQQAAEAERGVYASRARVQQAEAARREFARRVKPNDRADAERLRQLDAALEAARRDAAAAAQRSRGLTNQLATAIGTFSTQHDPRRTLTQLDDRIPLLLLPLRVETRFKRVTAGVELWVRVFPDECLVDSFEPLLSDTERRAGRRFWQEWWRAGGVEADRRTAWRTLVASTSSPRAGWIVRQLRPKNGPDEPLKAAPTETILVVPCVDPPTVSEQSALTQYWSVRWREPNNVSSEVSARSALESAVGAGRAAELLALIPFNLADEPTPPATRASAVVRLVFLALPGDDVGMTTPGSWNSAPVARLLPERLVLRAEQAGAVAFEVVGQPIPSPLVVGPDPNAPDADQLTQQNGVLSVPAAMRWMVDFDEAVKVGMAFRVPLTSDQASAGFDRVMVLGLRMSSDASESATSLEELIAHHRFGSSGFTLVRQGAATNNTESISAGHSRIDDAEASFDATFLTPMVSRVAPWEGKQDGQWLGELLGLDLTAIDGIERSTGGDQTVARAINAALWPATLGYEFETLLHPIFSEEAIDALRWFFTRFVSGRGWVPAIRIGSQPYGILPTSAIRRWRWMDGRLSLNISGAGGVAPPGSVLPPLLRTLQALESDWNALSAGVSSVDKAGDPHQLLLDIIGLHPTSVEFYQRFSQSLESVRARLRLFGPLRANTTRVLDVAQWQDDARQLLRQLGYTGSTDPEILKQIFYSAQQPLQGPFIDDRLPSEREEIRAYADNGRNYIRWLIDAARASLDEVRSEKGFTADEPPTALFYLLLRHAVMLGYWDTSVRMNINSGVLDGSARALVRRESPFVHVAAEGATSESRLALLYADEPRITGIPGRLVADHITSVLGSDVTRYLDEQLAALERVEHVSTAQLERAFVEHLDCASYRLDAWIQGLIQLQLALMRYGPTQSDNEGVRSGIHLGVFGWLEDVRPRARQENAVELEPSLAEFFAPPDATPLVQDLANGGYMLTPSLNHAVTAAVLRSGHLSNATPANASTLAVNVSSARVRVAQHILEGIRNGQSLGALLGYRFERGLHDRHAFAEVDRFILPLRKQFPLRADRLDTTKTPPGVSIEAIEARNVIDGGLLVDHIRTTGRKNYPFGLEAVLPTASNAQSSAIDAEVEELLAANDAVADVALAESVHQAAQGNFDRAAANLDAYGRGGLPPDPDVVRTPLGGLTVTHRVALHLPENASHTTSPVTGIAMTPRARCEPRLNAWLASRLPSPDRVYGTVRVTDAVTGNVTTLQITQRDLALQPIDLLSCIVDSTDPAMGELDDRLVRHVLSATALRPDSKIEIRFTEFVADRSQVSFFEIAPLLRALRNLVTHARPLRPTDLQLTGEADSKKDESIRIDPARVSDARTALDAARSTLAAIASTLAARLEDIATNHTLLIADVDTTIVSAAEAGAALMSFAVRVAIGEWYAWRAAMTARLVGLVTDRLVTWRLRRDDAVNRLLAYDALPPATPDDVRFAELDSIERLVARQATIPRLATTLLARAHVGNAVSTFEGRLTSLEAAITAATPTLAAVHSAVKALLPLDAFDVEPFKLDAVENEVIRFLGDLSSTLTTVLNDVDQRLIASQRALTEAANATTSSSRVDALVQGAKALFGEDFRSVPLFDLPAELRSELLNARAHAMSGDLLRFQTDEQTSREPVDTWLYGVARVREALQRWEQIVIHSEAFVSTELTLMPLQLPAQPALPWLALAYPSSTIIDGERLCYTAHFSNAFDPALPQCGLLIDEWPEVLPAKEQTAAVSFHFDRPNAEPPQCWLLATPSQFGDGWSWEDVVESVRETFERARRRAVEPAHLDATPYARVLPAVVTATTVFPIAITVNLARNNGLFHALAENPNA